jgi:hypothetical protein
LITRRALQNVTAEKKKKEKNVRVMMGTLLLVAAELLLVVVHDHHAGTDKLTVWLHKLLNHATSNTQMSELASKKWVE